VKVLKIDGKVIPDVTDFAWDGCHKVYLIRNDAEMDTMLDYGYGDDILPISELPDVWEQCCPLRFINSADLTQQFVEQCAEDVTVTYEEDVPLDLGHPKYGR
jgi:hypothetical protein